VLHRVELTVQAIHALISFLKNFPLVLQSSDPSHISCRSPRSHSLDLVIVLLRLCSVAVELHHRTVPGPVTSLALVHINARALPLSPSATAVSGHRSVTSASHAPLYCLGTTSASKPLPRVTPRPPPPLRLLRRALAVPVGELRMPRRRLQLADTSLRTMHAHTCLLGF
jgi:hypothetical protein